MFKINNKNTRVTSLMSFCVLIVNSEHVSYLFSNDYIFDIQQINVYWEVHYLFLD